MKSPPIQRIAEAKQRLRLPMLMECMGLGGHAKKSAPCPFHSDRHNSFSVWERESVWFFKCHAGCGEGDEISFLEIHGRISRADATKLYLEMAGAAPSARLLSRPNNHDHPRLTAPYLLSKEECYRAIEMAVRLREDHELCARIAKARGWKPETIRLLTCGPCLGWHEGKLAFIYESGVKLRWRDGNQRRFAFAFGNADSMWRDSFIMPETRRVIVCEGETDAISALDAGAEHIDLGTVVVALPSASIIRQSWGPLFTGREAILCFDADAAGQKALRKFAAAIAPHAAKIYKPRWNRKEAA